jgi:hypothetical protein
MEDKIKRLEEWVNNHYNVTICGWTAERSEGNFDDVFCDGSQSGESWAAYEVGQILGMDLEEPEEAEEEEW